MSIEVSTGISDVNADTFSISLDLPVVPSLLRPRSCMASLFSEKKEAPDFVICVELPYDGSQTAGTTISTQSTTKKGYEFWLIMMALMVSIFLAALDVVRHLLSLDRRLTSND